jgi:MFS family permease
LFQGGIVPSYAIIVREYFPAREAGGRIGLVIFATVVGMALGGWMSGAIFDLTGSYRAGVRARDRLEPREPRDRVVAADALAHAGRARLIQGTRDITRSRCTSWPSTNAWSPASAKPDFS